MVLSDMDDGDDFLAVINENDLFGHDGDTGPSSFSWADEFLSTAEGDGATASSVAQNHETISPTEVVPASLEGHHQLSSHQTVVSTQGYVAAGPTVQGSLPMGGVQMVQATGLVQQPQVQNTVSTVQQPIAMPSLGQLTQGTGNQIVQGPNGQLILKPVSGGQIYLQAQPHLQTLQPSSSPVSQIGQFQGTPQVINRILAPNQSPQTSSHAPATSPQVSRSLTPVQSLAGMGPVTMVTTKGQGHIVTAAPNVNVLQLPSNAQQQQVLARNLPIQLSNANTGINLQGASAVLQQAQGQGSIVQQGQNHGALLQQGQGQAAVLPGQGQNIVNTQNTVIQNPNVVNLNVAHVLCNNPQLQNQSSSTVHHMAAASNIQGTLIQTADGKNIIIPNQQMPQGQSINIQNLPQMTIQPQLNLTQPSNSTGSSMMGNTPTVLQGNLALGNLGNVIRLTANTGSAQPEAKPQTQVNTTAGATHFIGLNQQGQQILIQRNPTPTGQQQNIILRAVNPSNIVLPQQQTAAGVTGSSAQLQTNQAVTTQPMMVSSQPQGVQIQRIMTNAQGQQVKFVGQGGIQTPLTINIGSNISNLQSGVQTIQVLPQQQVAKPVNSSTIVGGDNTNQTPGVISNVHQQSSVQQPQVGMILTSQSVNSAQNSGLLAKQAVSFPQTIQQYQPHVSITTNASQVVHTSQAPHQQSTKFITSTSIPQQPIQDPQVSESPQQLLQSLQNVQIPISSQFQTSQIVPNLSTANATTVTTTVTQSRVQLATSTPNAQVVPSVALQQGIASQKSQQILQAKDNAPRLQHTIQISMEAQQQLARIQAEIKRLSSQKTLNNTQKTQLNNLMDAQKKILSQGQLVRQVQHLQHSTTAAPLTQQLLNQQSADKQQVLGQAAQNLIGQDVKPLTIKQIPQQPLIGQQSGKGQLPVKQENIATPLTLKHNDPAGIMTSVTSQPQHIQPQISLQTSLAGPSVKGNLVIKTEPSTSLSSSCTFSQTDIQPQTNLSSSQIKMENPISSSLSTCISANPTTSNITEKSQIPATVSTSPSAMIHHVAPPPPGKVPIAASPQVAVPTQIKIGNHILNLSLTPQQKEKVLGYLSKMTPEMQQQQISTFLKLQQQQQLQVQVQAQVKAQQNLQQQKQQQQQQQQQKRIVTSIPVPNTGKIPLTVQQIDNSGIVKTGEQIPAASQVTVTASPAGPKRVSFASLSTTDLIHQQLSKDQDNAVNPDTKTPFKSRRDTYRRLLRYHVYQSKHPPESIMQKDEEMFQEVAQCLLQKKDRMFDKFRILLLQESMREKKTAEMLMIQRLLNEDLTETVKAEKEIVKTSPELFVPMPLKHLQHEDQSNLKSDSFRETIIKQENLDSEPLNIKQESMTPSRPSTPKVRLVIRNDGQNFTSSLAADSNSGSDGSEGDNMDVEERLDCVEDSVKHETSGILLDNSNFLHVKQEQMDEEESAIFEKTKHWEGCGEKPFHSYVDEGDDSIMDSGCGMPLGDSGQDYNSVSSDGASNGVDSEMVHSVSGLHEDDDEDDVDDDEEGRNDPLSSSFDTSGAVGGLMSDSDLQDFPIHYHSQDKQGVGESLYDGRKHLFHSQDEKIDSGITSNSPPSPNKQLYGSHNFSDDEKVPFSQSELFSESGESTSTVARQDSASSLVENENSANNVTGYPRSGHASLAQYEPISSPEADHEDSFANMITHRVDSSYIINIGDQKSPSQLSVPDLGFSAASFSSSQTLDLKSTASIDISDEETTLYSDSDKETDQQDELLFKDQMQKAINSIVSLNQDSSPYTQDHQSNNFFSHHSFETNPTSQSEDLTFQHSPTPSNKEEKDDEVSMDDDLDAAVQSILT